MTTALQAKMIKAIAESEFTSVNGAVPESYDEADAVWANMIIYDAEDKGVFTSLVNAGLVEHSGGPSKDACVRLTEAGFAEYQSLNSMHS